MYKLYKVLIVLSIGAVPGLANYPGQLSYLLDAGATSLTVHNSGTGGTDILRKFNPGSGNRLRYSITPGLFIPPPSSTTYTTCAAPCTVNVNRNHGQQYEWIEYVDSSGNAFSPRRLAQPRGAYNANACGGTATLPQVELATITTAPMPMPLEIIAQDCFAQAHQFPLQSGHSSSSHRLYGRYYNLGYNNAGRPDGKLAIQINSAAYINLTNATVTGIDESRFWGGIGSFDQTREFTVPVVDGAIGGADTTVAYRPLFRGTEGISSGTYILALNIIEADKSCTQIVVTSNVAVMTCASHGYTTADTVLVRNAPGMYMRFNGLRSITVLTSDTFSFVPCNTDTAGCTSPNGTYTVPVNRDTIGAASNVQPVMYAARGIIPKSAFVATDPSTWTAPGGADATRGGNLFKFGNAAGTADQTFQLYNPNLSYFNNVLTRATCGGKVGCHTSTGSDLYRFNYSNRSIKQRTIFHGFTDQDGDDIAAYIRGLSATLGAAPAKGRPWNPPFQPGPGMSTATTAEFFAGAGRDAVTTYAYADFYECISVDKAKWLWNSRLEVRDCPIPYPGADWNKGWLPVFHPADALPASSFLTSAMYLDYIDILDNMTAGNFASYQAHNYGLGQSVFEYKTWIDTQVNSIGHNITAAGNHYPSPYPLIRSSLPKYSLTRLYEVYVDKDTFKFGGQWAQATKGGNATPTPNWPLVNGTLDGSIFNSPSHKFDYKSFLDCSACNGGARMDTLNTEANWWYWAEPIKGGGLGWGVADGPIDFAYLQAFQSDVQEKRPGGYLSFIYPVIVTTQNGNLNTNVHYYPTANSSGNDLQSLWNVFVSYEKRQSYFWFTEAEWKTMIDDWLDLANAVVVSRNEAYWTTIFTNGGDTSPLASRAWNISSGGIGDMSAMMLPLFKVWGADATKLQTYVDWLESIDLWNGHDWQADLDAGVQGNVANTVTGNFLTPGANTATYTSSCPESASYFTGGGPYMPINVSGGAGADEMVRPTGGTCAVAGGSGTLVLPTVNVHAASGNTFKFGCFPGPLTTNWIAAVDQPRWWKCLNHF